MNNPSSVMTKVKKYWRKLPVRVALFAVAALFAVGLVQFVGPWVPDKVDAYVDTRSVDRLLDHIASAMLVVTTFSLTVMISVHQASASQWTPRVHQLLMEDSTTQNTLATFVGAYVYALTAITLRELGFIASEGATVSFAMTLIVLGMVVYALIRWIFHLQKLGSQIYVSRRIEATVEQEFAARYAMPCMGGRALTAATKIPENAIVVPALSSGYISHIWVKALNDQAERWGVKVFVCAPVGDFVAKGDAIAQVAMVGRPREHRSDDALVEDMVQGHIDVSDVRTFGQDPRFGLLVMAEVASKALSPGINDHGTAVDIIHRLTRLLMPYQDEDTAADPPYDRVYIPPLAPAELLQDAFDTIARDGADMVEIQVLLQNALSELMRNPNASMQDAVRKMALRFGADAQKALARPFDQDRLKAAMAAGPKA